MSFHSRQSFSISFFHVSLGKSVPRLPSICISHAVQTAPLERSTCQNQRSMNKNERGTTKGNFQLTIYKEVLTQPCRKSRKLETQHRQTTGRRISTWPFLDFYVEVILTQVDGTAVLASQMLPEIK